MPCYNCAPQISRVIAQFDQSNYHYFSKIAVLNNKSTDNTEEEAIKALGANPYISGAVYTHSQNFGYGGSLKVGFNLGIEGGYDYVLVMHGDDQANINDILPYIKDNTIENYDCVLGARFHKKSKLENYSKFRTFGNKVFNSIFSFVLRKTIIDLGSGLNIYKLSTFSDRDYMKFPDDLTFDYCGLMSHSFRGRKIKYIPISWREDDQVSNVKMVRQAFNSLKLLASYAINQQAFFNKEKMITKGLAYSSFAIYNKCEQQK